MIDNKTNANSEYTTIPMEKVTQEQVETAMPKSEFIKMLFTDRRFRFVPNKRKIALKIQRINDEEYRELLQKAFGQLKNRKK